MAIGWAVIGTGRMSRWMVPAIKDAEECNLVAVLSREKDRAAAFAQEHGVKRAYDSLEKLLRDPEVDVVYVASPNGLHSMQTIKAAEAGKHILCEKPMAPSLEECYAMVEACQRRGVKLALGFQFRHYPAQQKAREIVASGELGALVFANVQVELPAVRMPDWYYEPGMAGGGVMSLVGVHRIDLLRFILGCEVREVAAFVGEQTPQRPFEEIMVAILTFVNGAYGTLHFSLNIPHGSDPLEVHGSKGSLFGDSTSAWWGTPRGELLLKSGNATMKYRFEQTNAYRDEVEDFNRSVKEGGEPLATGVDGLRAAEISIALFESARQRKVIRIGA